MSTLFAVARQALGLWRVRGPLWGFYRIHLIAVGVRLGLFEAIGAGATVDTVVDKLHLDRELLTGWLSLAERSRLVRRQGAGYALSPFAETYLLPQSSHDLGHSIEEAVTLQGPLLQKLPDLMRSGERLLEGPEAAVTGALASIILEPFAFRVLRRLPVRQRGYTVLDVGCGHGDYLRFLARLNPTLTGFGIELTEGGAALARQRAEADGLSDRLRIVQADARELALGQRFHLCLLNNNLYYFHPDERISLFERLGEHLVDGGYLAVQVPMARRHFSDPLVDIFELYMLAHENLYGVPAEGDVRGALGAAGFKQVRRIPLWPFGQWVYFVARR